MIQHSVTIMRGCFGGCTFCSITEHEGRIIQSRSEDSIIREIEDIRDHFPGIHRRHLRSRRSHRQHVPSSLQEQGNRGQLPPSVLCLSGDLQEPRYRPWTVDQALPARQSPAGNQEDTHRLGLCATIWRCDHRSTSGNWLRHHVGGYLKIAPEHTETGPLSKMMKPGIGTYDQFKLLFDKYSREAGKEQYLIPYFIAAHPGTTDEDMLNLALWLKKNGFRADQVQAFLPSPMATATAMYHSGKNPLRKVSRTGESVYIPRSMKQRRLHKAFLRYHDPNNWPLLRETLKRMGRSDLIGNGKHHLIPSFQPAGTGEQGEGKRVSGRSLPFRTQHNGLPREAKLHRRTSKTARGTR